MDAFDSDAIIYAAVPDHPLGRRVLALFRQGGRQPAGAGSVLLLPEILGKPLHDGQTTEVRILAGLLSCIDRATGDLATALASKYGLRAADATHLATAVGLGAERFITNNQRDFPRGITEVKATYPGDLSDVTGTG